MIYRVHAQYALSPLPGCCLSPKGQTYLFRMLWQAEGAWADGGQIPFALGQRPGGPFASRQSSSQHGQRQTQGTHFWPLWCKSWHPYCSFWSTHIAAITNPRLKPPLTQICNDLWSPKATRYLMAMTANLLCRSNCQLLCSEWTVTMFYHECVKTSVSAQWQIMESVMLWLHCDESGMCWVTTITVTRTKRRKDKNGNNYNLKKRGIIIAIYWWYW